MWSEAQYCTITLHNHRPGHGTDEFQVFVQVDLSPGELCLWLYVSDNMAQTLLYAESLIDNNRLLGEGDVV